MKLTLPLPPSLNNLYPTMPNGYRLKSKQYKAWEAEADRWLLPQVGGGASLLTSADVKVTYTFYMNKRADLDNRIKAGQDYLTGIVWESDIQVAELHAYRHIDKLNPRVEVEIEEMEP